METVNNLNESYIVYITTNTQNKKIYIGVHKTSTPDKFDNYLGCAVYANKPYSYAKPKTRFQHAVKKYGPKSFIRKTLKVFDNEEDAYFLEAELVNKEFLSRPDVYNMVLGGNTQFKAIYQFAEDGKYETCYESVSTAAIMNNSCSSNICRAIKIGYKVNGKYFSDIYKEQFSVAKNEKIRNRPVYQYTLNGTFIKRFENINQARVELGLKSDINVAIKMGVTCGGFQWSLEELPCMPSTERKTGIARKVAVYNLEGELIETFRTVTECQNKYSGCKHVLHGKRKTSANCVFKYID